MGRFFRSNPVFLFITTAPDDSVESIDIVGNLCTSADCLGQNVEAPRLDEGDLVVIVANGVFHHLDDPAHTIKCGLSPILFIADNSLNLRTDIAISPDELGGGYFFNGLELHRY